MIAHSEFKKGLHNVFDKASLKMILAPGVLITGLAYNAVYMHRLAPSEGHVVGLTGKSCQNASYRSLRD